MRELAKERKKKRDLKDLDRGVMQEEYGWESPGVEEGVTAIGLLQRSAGSVSEDDEPKDVLISEGEELGGLMNQLPRG